MTKALEKELMQRYPSMTWNEAQEVVLFAKGALGIPSHKEGDYDERRDSILTTAIAEYERRPKKRVAQTDDKAETTRGFFQGIPKLFGRAWSKQDHKGATFSEYECVDARNGCCV